mgnify:CR=1 FL=1
MSGIQIKSFQAVHPNPSDAPRVASVPYDVISRLEASKIAAFNEDSFIRVVRSEIDFPNECSPYEEQIYKKARLNYEKLLEKGLLVKDSEAGIYLYRQCIDNHQQVGLVACCHVDDYNTNRIKKHEKTRQTKEDDRTKHVLELNANSGPVFLTYSADNNIDALIANEMIKRPMFHFVANDGVTHTGWKVVNCDNLIDACKAINVAYVADGHHRSASAARAAIERRKNNPNHNGEEEYNWFLAVLFPTNQLNIMPYNRVVFDLNGLSQLEFDEAIKGSKEFNVSPSDNPSPQIPGTCCYYLGKDFGWQQITFNPQAIRGNDPIASLDVDLLQQKILAPILGIGDPRSDMRIDFVGGIRGTEALEERVNNGDAAIAFSMHQTTIKQLLEVADANLIMPPKSTWFEPKLRSGLFVHELD